MLLYFCPKVAIDYLFPSRFCYTDAKIASKEVLLQTFYHDMADIIQQVDREPLTAP